MNHEKDKFKHVNESMMISKKGRHRIIYAFCIFCVFLAASGTIRTHGAVVKPKQAKSPQKRMIMDHEVVLDKKGRLQPWTSYRSIITKSMDFIFNCPTRQTTLGNDPWYLITSELNKDGSFRANQNNQGSNAYWAVETADRYYGYTKDKRSFEPARLLLERIYKFRTPAKWAWSHVPRTQDNSPDGVYTDETSEVDKMCMVGAAYLKYDELTGGRTYEKAALDIAEAVSRHIKPGDATHSPLPFRVILRTGDVLDPYTANMVMPVIFFDRLIERGYDTDGRYAAVRDKLWAWIIKYPVANNEWIGYYEDTYLDDGNLNQQIPLETARYMLRNQARVPEYKTYVPEILKWVKNNFGLTKHYGATSIREQIKCFFEMSSHTARYASVAAAWYAESGDTAWREEARASAALATYSALGNIEQNGYPINYVGIGFVNPWFSDSYFDYIPHLLDTLAALHELDSPR
jgi:hypothetical protein